MSADIELQRVVVSILSALDTVGVFGFFKSSGPTLALAPHHPTFSLLPYCFSLFPARVADFFPLFPLLFYFFRFFPPSFFSFSPGTGINRARCTVYRSLSVRGHRVETSNVGPVHGTKIRARSEKNRSEKDERNNGRTTFWTTLSGKLSKGIEGEYIRRSLERGKRWRRFVHFPRRAKSGTFRVLITPRESRLPPSHPRDHCIPYRTVRPFRFSERVRNGKASIPDILPSVRSTAAVFVRSTENFETETGKRERERDGEKMRGGSRVKKNFKPGRKRFDAANCPLFSSPRFRFVADATKFIVRHERVLFLVSLATLRPCVTRHARGSLNN